jgi:hypothetical protein
MSTHAHAEAADRTHPAPHRNEVSLAALWFGLFGAPLAWAVQELVDAAISAHACYPGPVPLDSPAISGTFAASLIVSIAAALASVFALATALRSYQRTRNETPGTSHHLMEVGEGRTRFMALSGIAIGAIFLLNTIMNGVALFLVPPCG